MIRVIFFPLLLVIGLAGCVTILPSRKDDDGSTSLTKIDSSKIREFSQLIKYADYKKKEELDFEYLTASDIKKTMPRYDYTVVEVSASWCSHCYVSLTRLKKLQEALQQRNTALFFAWQNVNVPVMQKQLFNAGYHTRSYIINPLIYGTDENRKQTAFCKELNNQHDTTYAGTVPLLMIFDKNGKCVKDKYGEAGIDEILSYLK